MLGTDKAQKFRFKSQSFGNRNIRIRTVVDCPKGQSHFSRIQRTELFLFHQFGYDFAMLQLFARSFIQIGCKLRESRQFTILRQRQTDTATQFFDDFGLCCTTYARYGNTGIDCRTDTGVEQVGFQEDLAVCNRNYVGWYECRYVTGLGFNNRQCSQRTGFAFYFAIGQFFNFVFADTGRTFQQTGVQVEYIARICFTTRRTAQQQGNLTVCNGLFRQVIIYDQRIFTAVTEEFAHGTTGVRSDILQRSGFRSSCSNYNSMFHRAMLFQFAHYVGNRRCFLTDSHINTDYACTFLVNDGIQCYGSFTGLTVTNDQLTLTTTNRNHRVNGFQAGLHWLVNRFTRNHTRCDFFDRGGQSCINRAFAVDRPTQCINDASDQFAPDRHFQDTTGTGNRVAFFNMFVLAQHYGADGVALQVHRQAESVTREFEHLTLHCI
ncbi:hypothetical protein NM90_2208 [Neisseria meningitidis NM90]|nr:hypothetical protein NM90_2208 [Neisseria meningitidis NM90]